MRHYSYSSLSLLQCVNFSVMGFQSSRLVIQHICLLNRAWHPQHEWSAPLFLNREQNTLPQRFSNQKLNRKRKSHTETAFALLAMVHTWSADCWSFSNQSCWLESHDLTWNLTWQNQNRICKSSFDSHFTSDLSLMVSSVLFLFLKPVHPLWFTDTCWLSP